MKKGRFTLKSVGSTTKGDDGVFSKPTSINTNMRISYVEPKELKINPLNSKYFNPLPPGEYEKLKQNIKEHGIQEPLQVKRDYTILAGENRFNIALELELKRIPIILKDFLNEKAEKNFIIGDNLLRRHLTPGEKQTLLKEMYGDEIFLHGKIGGDRRSEEAKKKAAEEKTFIEKVIDETGISKATAKKHLAAIRKEAKEPEEQEKSKKLSPSVDFLEKQINSVKKTINKIEPNQIATKEKRKIIVLLKELATIAKEW